MSYCATCGEPVGRLRANGYPFKHCSPECEKDAMSVRFMKLPTPKNPMCSCGCGQEIARPWNKFIMGHSAIRKLTGDQVLAAKALLGCGWSQGRIARVLGVSQATICQIRFGHHDRRTTEGKRFIAETARDIVRQDKIDEWKNYLKEVRSFREAKIVAKQMKGFLRELTNAR